MHSLVLKPFCTLTDFLTKRLLKAFRCFMKLNCALAMFSIYITDWKSFDFWEFMTRLDIMVITANLRMHSWWLHSYVLIHYLHGATYSLCFSIYIISENVIPLAGFIPICQQCTWDWLQFDICAIQCLWCNSLSLFQYLLLLLHFERHFLFYILLLLNSFPSTFCTLAFHIAIVFSNAEGTCREGPGHQ